MIMEKVVFNARVSGCKIESEKLRSFSGKEVEIEVRERIRKKRNKRKWTQFGKVNLGGKMDSVNLRDFLYE